MKAGIATCKLELTGRVNGKDPVVFLHLGKSYSMTEEEDGVMLVELEALETLLPMSPQIFEQHFDEVCWEYVPEEAKGAQDVEK